MVLLEGRHLKSLEVKKNDSEEEEEIAYHNFVESFKSEATKRVYVQSFDSFLDFLLQQQEQGQGQELKVLLLLIQQNNQKDIENLIISYILKLRKDGYAYSSINTMISGITYFFSINDIVLNKKKICRYMGEHVKTVKDRAYTREEIKKIFECCNLKNKIIVSLMASTGCRIGAIAKLKLSDIKYIEKEKLHQIFFYTNTKEEYYSFCSYECSKYIDEYLDLRKRCGEKINEKSPLIRDDFQQDDLLRAENPKPLTTYNLTFYIRKVLIASGIRNPIKMEFRGPKKKMRKQVAANHGFRKFAMTTMANARISPEIREMLLGHSIGLSNAYYRPSVSEMLNEYLKVVNDLIIDPSHRLQKTILELEEKGNYQNYIIDQKINDLTSRLNQYEEIEREGRIMSKEHAKRFAELHEKIQVLKAQFDNERQLNRDFETETDPEVKDHKFDKMISATRETIRKRGDLEKHLQQQQQ